MVVYEIVNISTGERYIGSTLRLRRRVVIHKYHLKRRSHHSWKLQAAFDVVGWGGFRVQTLENCQPGDDLRVREQHYLDTLRPSYNVSLTAEVPTMTPAGRKSVGDKCKARALQIKGHPVSYWAEKLGLTATTISSRLATGWSVERALSTPPNPRHTVGKLLTYNGETLALNKMAKKHGWSPATLCRRLQEGMSVEDALTTPPRPKHRKAGDRVQPSI